MKSIGWICLVFLLVIPISFSNIAINMGAPENASYSLNNIPIYFNVTGRAESYLCVNKFDVSNNNLTGYWRFDENNGTTIIDSSEYGNNGTISLDSNFFDGVALNENTTWTTSGKYGSGYKLNGLAGITFFENFTNSSAYTFCVWVKPENISATSFRFPLINTNGIGNQGEFYISYSSTRFDFAKASWDSWTAMTPIYNDTWTHLCVVLNDTKAYLYKDGTKLSLSTDDTTTGNLSFNGNISSGYRAGTTLTTTKMNDTIDEIRIWNRTLTTSEINEEMNSRFPYNGNSLVASWSFEENNTNNATFDTKEYTNGKLGSSLNFINKGDYAEIESADDFNQTTPFTLSFWLKLHQKTSTVNQSIIGRDGNAGEHGWGIYLNPSGNMIFMVSDDGNNLNQTNETDFTTTINEWMFVTAVFDGNLIKLYKNSNLVSYKSFASSIYDNKRKIMIGKHETETIASKHSFNGTIDELRYYNRSLSSAEITNLYNLYSSPYGVANNTLYSKTESITSGSHNILLECRDNTSYYLSSNYTDVYFSLYTLYITTFDEQTYSSVNFNITITNLTYSVNQTDVDSFKSGWENLPLGDVDIYISSYGYIQRKFTSTISVTSILNITAYLLQENQGNFIRFHVKDQSGGVIKNVDVTAYKYINFEWKIVEDTSTDDAGMGTLFLNPLTTYTIEFKKSGYTSANYSIQPSSPDYTITMTSISEYQPTQEQLTNITYSIKPDYNVTAKNVTFSFTIYSFDSKLEWWAFNVTHNVTSYFFSNETTSSGGTNSTTLNLGNGTFNPNSSIVVYAIFKKQNVANPFYINRSYYIWKVEAPSNTSIVGISNWVKEEFDLEHSSSYNKLWFGMGIIMLALIGGGIVGGDGGGFVSLGIIGIGMFIGFLTFFPTGTGMNAGVIFGIMVIGFLAYIFLRGGI